MKKIPCLFKRDYSKNCRPMVNEILEGSEWVINGKGIATRKFDGTCCMIKKGRFYKRYTYRSKKNKQSPGDFYSVTEIDSITGKQFGWRPVRSSDIYHMEAYNNQRLCIYMSSMYGTYELCGPKIQGNPEKCEKHILIKHGCEHLYNAPRDFNGLKQYFINNDIEGIVWHHKDGRMVKIKGIDFGISRGKIVGRSVDMIITDDVINH